MAYVPGFENDVFISYAQLDNKEMIPANPNSQWVTSLHNLLRDRICQNLGSDELKVWRDKHDHRGNEEITPEINRNVSSSALLLVVMTPAVLSRPWCKQERELFAKQCESAEVRGRIFLVHKDHTSHETWPAEFEDRGGYEFFSRNPANGRVKTAGVPVPNENDTLYFDQLDALAEDIANKLKVMRTAAEAKAEPAPEMTPEELEAATQQAMAIYHGDAQDAWRDLWAEVPDASE